MKVRYEVEETGRTIVHGNVEGDVVGIFGNGKGDGPLLYMDVNINVTNINMKVMPYSEGRWSGR